MITKHFLIPTLIILASVKIGRAQQSLKIENQAVILTRNYVENTGTSYSTVDWVKGTIKQADGITSNDLLLKYDEEIDELYFKRDQNGEVLKFVNPITEFTLSQVDKDNKPIEKHYRNGYKKTNYSTELSYYEVLCDGKVQLLKKNKKYKSVDSATGTYIINDNIRYYLLVEDKLIIINKDKKSILKALGNKKAGFDNFMKTNDLDLQNDADLAKLIAGYNAL